LPLFPEATPFEWMASSVQPFQVFPLIQSFQEAPLLLQQALRPDGRGGLPANEAGGVPQAEDGAGRNPFHPVCRTAVQA
jgi:hypothetical protein